MRILLVDVDSKIPNLALMKLSAWHKAHGDEIGFNVPAPDRIYASVILPKNKHLVDGLRMMHPGAEVICGGTGYDIKAVLPPEVEAMKPDYDLYPGMNYSMGFITRGCIRHCYFCFVPKKEGRLVRAQHPREFHDDRFKEILVMDNNWLADREWFMETSQWIIDKGLLLHEGGMDARLIDRDLAHQIKKFKMGGKLHIAWDFEKDGEEVLRGISALQEAKYDTRSNLLCYLYFPDDSHYDSILHRSRMLKEAKCSPFIMIDPECPKITRRMKELRWIVNRPMAFWTKGSLGGEIKARW